MLQALLAALVRLQSVNPCRRCIHMKSISNIVKLDLLFLGNMESLKHHSIITLMPSLYRVSIINGLSTYCTHKL